MTYIIWNHDGMLFDLGFYALRWYSLLFALGFVICYYLLKRRFIKEQVPLEKLDKITIYSIAGAVIGARLGHCLFYDFEYYSQHLLEIFLPFQFEPTFEFIGYRGLASHGGGIAILIALIICSRKYKMDLLWIFDRLAVVAPIAAASIRFGNFMNSEIIGNPTTVPWAFIFQRVDNIPRHPGQLYEAVVYLIIFGVLYTLNKRQKKGNGFIFGLFMIMVFSARFIIEFFKADQSAFEAGMMINMGQVLSIPFVILGITLMVLKRKEAKADKETEL
ncbi:prolipoprotein diacylglyceryl transferase [Fulvivirgaceae bacterium BMA10]|uniref:Phosphatidylglycerol--prolipoprotein diacylglyceryl transferase n=1 Tax=Splendidivirga corallicola TaxID=3051826 RepID=A0ABT8KTN4_9BACT|nr:prolipoprotein diacylglyceryl transferase [Fulvivirgaceae bacterium BMA10]